MADPDLRSREHGWADHERAQRRAWLALSYRERLDWLWQAKQFAARARNVTLRPLQPGAKATR